MPPIPTAVMVAACRATPTGVGEQSAVVWNRVYFKPFCGKTLEIRGVATGPPNAELAAPNPTVVDEAR